MTLTPRQLDCLRLAADGHTYAEIGRQMYLSHYAVRTNLSRAASQLGATNTTHAVSIAYRRGLLGDTEDRQQVAIVRLAESMGCWIALVPRGGA